MCSPKPVPPFPFFAYCCIGSGGHLLFHARQQAKAPGGHINYIAAPPLFSQVFLWVCLLSQTVPICSLSIFTALCVCVRAFIFMITNIFLHIHKYTVIVHAPLLPLWQVIIVGGKILPGEHSLPQAQLYNRFRCVRVCACVFSWVCLWLPEQGMAAFAVYVFIHCFISFTCLGKFILKWKYMHAQHDT